MALPGRCAAQLCSFPACSSPGLQYRMLGTGAHHVLDWYYSIIQQSGSRMFARSPQNPAPGAWPSATVYRKFPNKDGPGVQVADAGLLARYQTLLTSAERAHVDAAANARLRRERLLARALVRTVLARHACARVAV